MLCLSIINATPNSWWSEPSAAAFRNKNLIDGNYWLVLEIGKTPTWTLFFFLQGYLNARLNKERNRRWMDFTLLQYFSHFHTGRQTKSRHARIVAPRRQMYRYPGVPHPPSMTSHCTMALLKQKTACHCVPLPASHSSSCMQMRISFSFLLLGEPFVHQLGKTACLAHLHKLRPFSHTQIETAHLIEYLFFV